MWRASGIGHDLRKTSAYSGYEQYDFDVPTHTDGDILCRYLMRAEEMRQSLRIVEQALNKLPMGPVRSNIQYVPPPRMRSAPAWKR
jgi:NADH-quinone oxidoreductase subunit D